MRRAITLLFLFSCLGLAATIRLYLKDGTYQLVREYQVQSDRVRYYTVERGDWEEIPLDLVDLKRTEAEVKSREEMMKEDTAAMAAEEKAERAAAAEVARVPVEPGAYLVQGKALVTIPPGESTVVNNKRRNILKALSPVPMVSGKGWVELKGDQAQTVAESNTPEFYLRLAKEERFGIIRLAPGKDARIVEKLTIVPVSKEIVEEQDQVEVFRRQVGDGLYKIWPMKPLEPGQYAVVEFSPAGTEGINIQVWDFGVMTKSK